MMALAGFLCRRRKILNYHTDQVITQLMLYITLPALILYSLNTSLTLVILTDLFYLVMMSSFILTVSIFLAAWLRKKSRLPAKQKSVYEALIIFGNQGFIGFAIIYVLMGEEGIIYLTFFNIVYLILIWTYGIYLFTKNKKKVNWKGLYFNPGIMSTLIGLAMMLLPFNWPGPLLATFESVGKMTIPLSMILIGSMLADMRWYELQTYSKNLYIWIATSCRLLLLPLLLIIFIFFQIPYPLVVIAVLTSATPSASTISIYAQKFGGDPEFASFGVIVTTLLCMLTIPMLYSLLQWLYPLFY